MRNSGGLKKALEHSWGLFSGLEFSLALYISNGLSYLCCVLCGLLSSKLRKKTLHDGSSFMARIIRVRVSMIALWRPSVESGVRKSFG